MNNDKVYVWCLSFVVSDAHSLLKNIVFILIETVGTVREAWL